MKGLLRRKSFESAENKSGEEDDDALSGQKASTSCQPQLGASVTLESFLECRETEGGRQKDDWKKDGLRWGLKACIKKYLKHLPEERCFDNNPCQVIPVAQEMCV